MWIRVGSGFTMTCFFLAAENGQRPWKSAEHGVENEFH